jgi:hypothetical protein
LIEETFIVKEPGAGGVQQLIEQYRYIEALRKPYNEFFPAVRNLQVFGNTYAQYHMEEVPYPTFRDCLLGNPHKGLHSCFSLDKAVTLLKNVMEFALGKLATSCTYDVPSNYLEYFVWGKYTQRLQETKGLIAKLVTMPKEDHYYLTWLQNTLDAELIVVNNKEYRNPYHLLNQVQQAKNCDAILTPKKLYHIHGDLHFENILIDPDDPQLSKFKLIDPRGFPTGADIAYDVGKLLHSCHGKYDFLHREYFDLDPVVVGTSTGVNVKIKGPHMVETTMGGGGSHGRLREYRLILNKSEQLLFDFINRELEGIVMAIFEKEEELKDDRTWKCRSYLMEALHFCTMLPFHIEDSAKRVVALYTQGVKLINEWYEDFAGELL